MQWGQLFQHPRPSRHNLIQQPCSLVSSILSLINKGSRWHAAVHAVRASHEHWANEITPHPDNHQGELPTLHEAKREKATEKQRMPGQIHRLESLSRGEGTRTLCNCLLDLSALCPLCTEKKKWAPQRKTLFLRNTQLSSRIRTLCYQQTIPNTQNEANHSRFPLVSNRAASNGQAKNAKEFHLTVHNHVHLLWVLPSVFLAFDSKTSLPYPCCTDLFSP